MTPSFHVPDSECKSRVTRFCWQCQNATKVSAGGARGHSLCLMNKVRAQLTLSKSLSKLGRGRTDRCEYHAVHFFITSPTTPGHKGVHGAKPGWWRDRRIEESENGQWKRRISYHRHSRNQDFELSEPYERNQAQGNSHFASAGSFPLLTQLTSDPVISDSPAEYG